MGHEIRWGGDPEDLTITFFGPVPLDELFAAFDEVRAAPGYTTALRMIHDHRRTDWSGVDGNEIRRRAERLIAYARPEERHRVAILVRDPLPFGFMRMRELLVDDEIRTVDRIFYEVDEARAWLRGPEE